MLLVSRASPRTPRRAITARTSAARAVTATEFRERFAVWPGPVAEPMTAGLEVEQGVEADGDARAVGRPRFTASSTPGMNDVRS